MKPVFTAVEMFAGAGGAALGLKEAGFYSLAAIEMWDVAAKTLRAAGFPVVEGRVEDPKVATIYDQGREQGGPRSQPRAARGGGCARRGLEEARVRAACAYT